MVVNRMKVRRTSLFILMKWNENVALLFVFGLGAYHTASIVYLVISKFIICSCRNNIPTEINIIIIRASVRDRPLKHLDMFAHRRVPTSLLVPRAAVLARPPQHLEVPAARRHPARPLVPRAAVHAQPLQHLEVPATRRRHACVCLQLTAVLAPPLQRLQLSEPR